MFCGDGVELKRPSPLRNRGADRAKKPVDSSSEVDGTAQAVTLAVDRGLIVVNGRGMALDSLWRNGTAAAAYWLWRDHFARMP